MGALRWDFGAILMWGLWGGELGPAAQCPGGGTGVREQGRGDSGLRVQFSRARLCQVGRRLGVKGDENPGKTEVDMAASRLAQPEKEGSAVGADGGGEGREREPQVPGVVHLDAKACSWDP